MSALIVDAQPSSSLDTNQTTQSQTQSLTYNPKDIMTFPKIEMLIQ